MAFLNAFLVIFGKKEQMRNKNKDLKHPPSQEARRTPVKENEA